MVKLLSLKQKNIISIRLLPFVKGRHGLRYYDPAMFTRRTNIDKVDMGVSRRLADLKSFDYSSFFKCGFYRPDIYLYRFRGYGNKLILWRDMPSLDWFDNDFEIGLTSVTRSSVIQNLDQMWCVEPTSFCLLSV